MLFESWHCRGASAVLEQAENSSLELNQEKTQI
jgi:hypothetical protein